MFVKRHSYISHICEQTLIYIQKRTEDVNLFTNISLYWQAMDYSLIWFKSDRQYLTSASLRFLIDLFDWNVPTKDVNDIRRDISGPLMSVIFNTQHCQATSRTIMQSLFWRKRRERDNEHYSEECGTCNSYSLISYWSSFIWI